MEQSIIPYHAVKHLEGGRILVFAPHPDDEVFGCGGAILSHVNRQAHLQVIIVSDGGFGVAEEERPAYVGRRQDESVKAAEVLGYGAPVFWELRDREVVYGEKLVCRLLEAIRAFDADLVYAPSVFEVHPDHRAVGMATVEAVRRYGKGLRLALYEVGMPLHPNLLLDISDFAERKRGAMECFASQLGKQRYDLDIAALNRYRTYTLSHDVTAAEAYILVGSEELADDPLRLYQSEHDRQEELGLKLDSRDIPLVSVIIRSMDRVTLSDALDSVALQTYPNIEVVIVNAKGAAHRKVEEWCGRFPLRFISSGKPLHRSRAANAGLEAARGSYLIFLDDDDWFLPDHIAGLVSTLSNTPSFMAAYSGVKYADSRRNLLEESFASPYDAIRLLAGNYIPIHAVLFSRELYVRNCRFDEQFDLYEDWDFWLQVASHTKFLFIDKYSACYRKSADGSDANNPTNNEVYGGLVLAKWRSKWSERQLFELVCLARESANYKNRADQMEYTYQSNKTYIEELRCHIKGLEEHLQELASCVPALRQTVAERDTQVSALQQAIGERNMQVSVLQKTADECNTQITALQQAVSECNTQVTALQHAIAERDAQIAACGATIQKIYHSHSWRLTRPLRFAVRLLSGRL